MQFARFSQTTRYGLSFFVIPHVPQDAIVSHCGPSVCHMKRQEELPQGLSIMYKLQPQVVTETQRCQRPLLNDLYHHPKYPLRERDHVCVQR